MQPHLYLVVSKNCVGLGQLEDLRLKSMFVTCHLLSHPLTSLLLFPWQSKCLPILPACLTECQLVWAFYGCCWPSETNLLWKEKRIAIYRQPGCCVEGVAFMWQIPHFAKNTGSKLSITPVFAVLLLTECVLLETLAASTAVTWLPQFGSPHNVCARQPSPQRTGGFLMAKVLQLHQSFV